MSKNQKSNTLPSGAPPDGSEDVRDVAATVAVPSVDGVSPDVVEANQRAIEAEKRAAAAEARLHDVEMKLDSILSSQGSPAKAVAEKMREAEHVQKASRLLRANARRSLRGRNGGDGEDAKMVIFRRPWKRGVYQPDGKMYSFKPEVAQSLVAGGVAVFPSDQKLRAERDRIEQIKYDSAILAGSMDE